MTKAEAISVLVAGGIAAFAGISIDFSGDLASDRAEVDAKCQTAFHLRHTDGGIDPATSEQVWVDDLQYLVSERQRSCSRFKRLRRRLHEGDTTVTKIMVRNARTNCVTAKTDVVTLRDQVRAAAAACEVAEIAYACQDDMALAEECP